LQHDRQQTVSIMKLQSVLDW